MNVQLATPTRTWQWPGEAQFCQCGRELVLCDNGERHCADTLEKFRVRHGYEYGAIKETKHG